MVVFHSYVGLLQGIPFWNRTHFRNHQAVWLCGPGLLPRPPKLPSASWLGCCQDRTGSSTCTNCPDLKNIDDFIPSISSSLTLALDIFACFSIAQYLWIHHFSPLWPPAVAPDQGDQRNRRGKAHTLLVGGPNASRLPLQPLGPWHRKHLLERPQNCRLPGHPAISGTKGCKESWVQAKKFSTQ